MTSKLEKRGQNIRRRLTKFSRKASEEGREHIQENLVGRISHAKNVRLLILEWSLLIASIIFLAITQAFWYRESYSVNSFTSGGSYSEATLGKVNSLNPLFASTSSERTLSKLLFSSLSADDYSAHTGLGLASSIIAADNDGKSWKVKLRDNLKWSDGEPITNADVIYTVNVIQDPSVRTPYASSLSGVKVSESEDNSLIFNLSSAYVNFPSSLDFPILPAHILSDTPNSSLAEHAFSTKPVTSGPFSYNATQSVGTEGEKIIYLSKNYSYYKTPPLLDSFSIHAFLSIDDVKNALKTGSVTATAELPSTDAPEVTNDLIIERQTSLNSGVYAFLNTASQALSSRKIRQALQIGVNANQLRSAAGNDLVRLDYPILTSQIDLNYPAIPAYDPASARDSITSLELPDNYNISIATVSTGHFPEIANQLSSQLHDLGLNSTVNIYEPNQDFLISVLRPRAYDILIYEIDLGPDPDLFAYYHSSAASSTGLNLSNYKSAIADDLILGARSTLDYSLRLNKYESFLRRWVEDVPAIGIYQTNLSYFVNKNTRSFSEDVTLVEPTDRFVDISYWATESTTNNRTP